MSQSASPPASPSGSPTRSSLPDGSAGLAARLPTVRAAIQRVRRRLRLWRALQHGVYGLIAGGALLWGATVAYRFGALSSPQLQRLGLFSGGLFFVGMLVGALRRIDPLTIAALIDQSHALYDRLSSALQFMGVGSTPPPSPLGPEAALRELAIADAEQAARGVEARRAAPFVRPQHLGLIPLLGLLSLFSLWIRLPRPSVTPPPVVAAPSAPEARLLVDPELIAPEKDELARLLADAEARGDEEAAAILRELQKLLEQVERGELTRKEAFDKLSELEQRLLRGKDGALEELKEKLRKAGNELSEAKLTRELGQALAKEDLAKAQAELKKLASEAMSRAQSDKDKSDRQAMAKAFERAAQGLRQNDAQKSSPPESEADKARAEERARRMNELQAEERRLKQQLEKNPQDAEAKRRLEEVQRELAQLSEQAKREQEERRAEAQKKDEWQGKTKEEERTRRSQELQEEERRLKKKLQENPQDEESERRLKKVQRELEQLEREKQEREQARRELEQLERDMQKAAEEMQKQLDRMSPEQRKALEKMMEDMQRLQEQLRRMGQGQGQQGQNGQQKPGQGQQGQGGRGPVTIALGSIKQVLRRVGRTGQGQGQQGQQGQNGQGQGQNGQGQQGQGGSGSMKDFMNRAKGQGQGQGQNGNGDSDVLIEGEGQGKDGQSMVLLGQGNDPVLLPGLGMGKGGGGEKGQNPGSGGPGNQPGGERPGTQHDPNFTGDVTQIDSKRRLTRVYGKEGAGPTRSETILGAAEKGFASQPYRKVYGDYTAVSERAMTQQRVPPGYRFYVKRYFQMIKPRE